MTTATTKQTRTPMPAGLPGRHFLAQLGIFSSEAEAKLTVARIRNATGIQQYHHEGIPYGWSNVQHLKCVDLWVATMGRLTEGEKSVALTVAFQLGAIPSK